MTTSAQTDPADACPAQGLLKLLSGKWKPEIFRLSLEGPLRFSVLLRRIEGASRQSLSVALKELEDGGLLAREVIRQKPLHVAYQLTEKGRALIPVFRQLEGLA